MFHNMGLGLPTRIARPSRAGSSPHVGPRVVALDRFYDALQRAYAGTLPLDRDQQSALDHDFSTPLWIIAGPGTGKTPTLVYLLLKRLLVDGVPPERVFLTTFTRKAAAELKSRVIVSREQLVWAGLDKAVELDLSSILLGTLHSLCSQVSRDQRHEETLRIRVLEDTLTQEFFVRRSRNPLLGQDDVRFWQRFGMARPTFAFAPRRSDESGPRSRRAAPE